MSNSANKLDFKGLSLRHFLFFLTYSLLSACSLFSGNQEPLHTAYITGDGLPNMPSDEIKKRLEQKAKMAGGYYRLSAWPITKPMIEAQKREMESAQALSEKELNVITKELNRKYLNDKVCFQVNFIIDKYDQVAQLKEWKASLYQGKFLDNPIPLQWDTIKQPIQTNFSSYHGKVPQWIFDGIACTSYAVDLGNDFSVDLSTNFAPWPFGNSVVFSWQLDEVKVIDGNKVIVPNKEKKKEGYRGW